MDIVAWHGWDQSEMEMLHSGSGTFPVAWIPAPEYPVMPNQDCSLNA
jgi:hypothetical protein